jgi:hypothetical protein
MRSRTDIANIEAFDPLEYFESIEGDLSLPNVEDLPQEIDESSWKRLVEEQRASGLLAMNDAEREVLLRGSIKAYLTNVSSTSRQIELDSAGQSKVGERYRTDDGLYVELTERHQQSDNADTDWGDTGLLVVGISESKSFVTLLGDKRHTDNWIRPGGSDWRCDSESDDEGYAFLQAQYYANLISLLDAVPVAYEMVDGRRTVRFELPYSDGMLNLWADDASLFPIAYSYPRVLRTDGVELMPDRRVSITGINNVTAVEPPGVCSKPP